MEESYRGTSPLHELDLPWPASETFLAWEELERRFREKNIPRAEFVAKGFGILMVSMFTTFPQLTVDAVVKQVQEFLTRSD